MCGCDVLAGSNQVVTILRDERAKRNLEWQRRGKHGCVIPHRRVQIHWVPADTHRVRKYGLLFSRIGRRQNILSDDSAQTLNPPRFTPVRGHSQSRTRPNRFGQQAQFGVTVTTSIVSLGLGLQPIQESQRKPPGLIQNGDLPLNRLIDRAGPVIIVSVPIDQGKVPSIPVRVKLASIKHSPVSPERQRALGGCFHEVIVDRLACPVIQSQAVGLAVLKHFVTSWFSDHMALTGAKLYKKAISKALDAFRVRAIDTGVSLTGIFLRLRSGYIRYARQRQQIPCVRSIQEELSPDRDLLSPMLNCHIFDMPWISLAIHRFRSCQNL